VHDPQLIILDEPTNGLDPNGILEMRELLKDLNRKHGLTILVSSHLLVEIERLVTHIGIIHRGNLLFQGTLPELISRQEQSSFTAFETSDNQRALEIIAATGVAARADNGRIAAPLLEKELIARVNQRLVNSGIDVYQISAVKNDLEAIFFDVIKD
jgi:ABC-2 type transport system ATP-binding protein